MHMASPTNLTDRLTQLRVRNAASTERGRPPRRGPPRKSGARPMRVDYFMVGVYSLVTVALCVQLYLIIWLDL